jgi:hypothetical protein
MARKPKVEGLQDSQITWKSKWDIFARSIVNSTPKPSITVFNPEVMGNMLTK